MLASVNGSKVSRRRADRFRFACGNLMESSGPAACRALFGRVDWVREGSGENILGEQKCSQVRKERRKERVDEMNDGSKLFVRDDGVWFRLGLLMAAILVASQPQTSTLT